MKKYNISKEYGIYRRIVPPFNKKVIEFSRIFLSNDLSKYKDIEIRKELLKTTYNDYINLYIFTPLNIKTDKVMLYIHGGAFVYKGYSKHYELCSKYAKEGFCKVVYVDYRLAPLYKYPTPISDCYKAYEWIIENANKLEIDVNKIIVGGDSAGGCLTIDVVNSAINSNNILPNSQMLIYPVLDKRMITNSMKEYVDTPMWNAKLNKKMWECYLGGQDYTSPMEITDLSKMPNTYIETAYYDCLRDEGIEFANRLRNSGIKVTLNETKNTMHGFDIKNCDITNEAVKSRVNFIKSVN